MDKYFIDFETKSDLDINKVGAMKYLHTPNSDIICMSWAKNPKNFCGEGEVKLWVPGMMFPFYPAMGDQVYAHNALFDWRVWNILGRKHLMPELPLNSMVDTMALCCRYTIFPDLDKAAKTLKVPMLKLKIGGALIKKITQPPFEYTEEDLQKFFAYAVGDCHAMIGIVNSLPSDHLSPEEQTYWKDTQEINNFGVPIDVPLVKRIWSTIRYHKAKEIKKLPEITEGQVSNITQTAAIAQFCRDHHYDMPDCTAETVARLIEEIDDEDDVCYQVLCMRRDLGRTSVAKFDKLLDQTYQGRIYDNLRYHIASTGRYGGSGFQIHNLPRASVENVEDTIAAFADTSILNGNPVYAGMALIRSCIHPLKGYLLVVVDYKAIENRIIAWLAGEDRIVKLFFDGLDEYIDFATTLYGVRYNDVTKEQRTRAKVVILGAGYGLGAAGLYEYARSFGIEFSEEQCGEAIYKYRSTHPQISGVGIAGDGLWYGLKNAAVNSVLNPGTDYWYGACRFRSTYDRRNRKWLVFTLPSERNLFYCEPEIHEDRYGPLVTHMGVNSYNKKWQRLRIIPGRLTENAVQALARDVLAHAKHNLLKSGYKVIASVHDETITEVPESTAETQLRNVTQIMCINPKWATGLPLDAEGEVLERYKKI